MLQKRRVRASTGQWVEHACDFHEGFSERNFCVAKGGKDVLVKAPLQCRTRAHRQATSDTPTLLRVYGNEREGTRYQQRGGVRVINRSAHARTHVKWRLAVCVSANCFAEFPQTLNIL